MDVGISAARIVKSLEAMGDSPKDIAGVFLTHEHVDHVRSVSAFHKKAPDAHFIASEGTASGLDEKVRTLIDGKLFTMGCGEEGCKHILLGDIEVECFSLSHDATEPMAYAFRKDGKKLVIVTDTGCVTDEIYEALADADLLVLEANHEENILLYGRYPYQVKRRILSDVGHLSNEAAGKCLCRMLRDLDGTKIPRVFLAHLSRENNTPEQAFLTVRNVLEEEDFFVGRDLIMEVIPEDGHLCLTEL